MAPSAIGIPPPPRSEMPPLPDGPLPSGKLYQFGSGDQSRGGRDAQSEFSFRSSNPPSLASRVDRERAGPGQGQADQYRPSHIDSGGPRRAQRNGGSRAGKDRSPQRGRYNHRGGRGNKPPTADRPLLRFNRGNTPEQMLGMNDNQSTENRFLAIDDMSDSAEEPMDESDQDEYEPPLEISSPAKRNPDAAEAKSEDSILASNGQALTQHVGNKVTTDNTVTAPKWSNPEYYTALPPPDESQRKKRDVVKLIRKARVAQDKNSSTSNQVVLNDDFISFEVGDNEDTGHGRGVPGAPSGPHLANNAANGNLKRKRPDEIMRTESFRSPKRKRVRNQDIDGGILEEWAWASNKAASPVPWVIENHNFTEMPGFRLHKEICDFYEFVKPQNFEQVVRQDLLERLRNVINSWKEGCELHCFGSFAAGLYLPNADMDVAVVSQDFRSHGVPSICRSYNQMQKLAYFLEDEGIAELRSIEIISQAKVPLIKFVDRLTRLKVDMSFENLTGVMAIQTFRLWEQEYPAMPIIVVIIKQFLMMRGLNEVVNGGLGGFSVTCLVTSLLQNMPRVKTKEFVPELHLGELLLEFLDLYGNQFDISRTGIRMQPPGYFDKRQWGLHKPSRFDRLCIIDPNKPDNDISGGSKIVELILARFSRARKEILYALSRPNRVSVLDWMLGGDYNDFLWQRQRLKNIYLEKWGSPEPESTDSNGTLYQEKVIITSGLVELDTVSAFKAVSVIKTTPAQGEEGSAVILTDFTVPSLANAPTPRPYPIDLSSTEQHHHKPPYEKPWSPHMQLVDNVKPDDLYPPAADLFTIAIGKAQAKINEARNEVIKACVPTGQNPTGSAASVSRSVSLQAETVYEEWRMTPNFLRLTKIRKIPLPMEVRSEGNSIEQRATTLLQWANAEAVKRIHVLENTPSSTKDSKFYQRGAILLTIQFPELKGLHWEKIEEAAMQVLTESGLDESVLLSVCGEKPKRLLAETGRVKKAGMDAPSAATVRKQKKNEKPLTKIGEVLSKTARRKQRKAMRRAARDLARDSDMGVMGSSHDNSILVE